jgi:tRNA(Ile)-lysidine synthase
MHATRTLEARFAARFEASELANRPTRVLVAVSGGCDSVVLLHLLTTAAREHPLELTVGHLDHAMREDSAADAEWVRRLCADWGTGFVVERLPSAPRSEAAARAARYRFLHRKAGEIGASLIATAHTADDQAETVLFRAARGTGLRGLAGIRDRTPDGVIRPLLPFWRAEIVDYAGRHGLSWRTDPTNAELGPARNRIRHRIIPELEAEVAPGARRSLVSLAKLAGEADAALERLAAAAEERVIRREGPDLVLARDLLQDYDSAVAVRIVRRALRRLGSVPGRTGTRAALQFITHARSGLQTRVPGGVRILVEFDQARLSPAGEPADRSAPDQPLDIARAGAGELGELRVGGARYRVTGAEAAPPAPPPTGWTVTLDPDRTSFPLRLRGWSPGDRIATAGGTKSLKKLFLEERIPRSRRARLPVLEDATGRVLWVAGVERPLPNAPGDGGRHFFLTIAND